jgi:hypothetical protein
VSEPAEREELPPEETSDELGVDRSQIRAMLALSPVERLELASQFAEGVLEIRARNDVRTIR